MPLSKEGGEVSLGACILVPVSISVVADSRVDSEDGEESSDEDGEESSKKWSISPGRLGWVVKLADPQAPEPRMKKGKSTGVRGVKYEDSDCVVLDGDPHKPVAATGAKGRSVRGRDASD